MERAIVSSSQHAAYHFHINLGLRRYRNVAITQRQTGSCVLYNNVYIYNVNTKYLNNKNVYCSVNIIHFSYMKIIILHSKIFNTLLKMTPLFYFNEITCVHELFDSSRAKVKTLYQHSIFFKCHNSNMRYKYTTCIL